MRAPDIILTSIYIYHRSKINLEVSEILRSIYKSKIADDMFYVESHTVS